MDCKAFQELGVRLPPHCPQSLSPNRDWVPMVVELRSRGSLWAAQLCAEHFQVLVRTG